MISVAPVSAADPALSTCLDLRRRVFVDEQGVPVELELDGRDPDCRHFLATAGGQPAGAARLRLTADGRAKAERVAVLAEWRRAGIGRALMRAIEDEAHRLGHAEVVLFAQADAVPFYEAIGYRAEGEPFTEAGIPHLALRKRLRAPG